MNAECLFCRIVAGEIPAEIVAESDHALAFRDIAPQAPTHVLVIPRRHAVDVPALAAADPTALADLVSLGSRVAEAEGAMGFRLVFNTGADAGQTVFHCHGHVLAGRALTWPPG